VGELNFTRILKRGLMHANEQALVDLGNGHDVTYRQHIDRVSRLIQVLKSLGIAPTDRVGVLAGSCHEYIELWHACLCGAAIINPLNNRLAPEEIVYILNDSATSVIFVDATYAPVIHGIRSRLPHLTTVVLIGQTDAPHDLRYDDLISGLSPAPLPPEPDDVAPAVLMYTGGTTGLPKGVILNQRAIVLVTYRSQMSMLISPGWRYLAFMPLFHVASIMTWSLLIPTGGCVVLMPAFDPVGVMNAVRDQRITAIAGVPTMFGLIVHHPSFEPSMFETLNLLGYGAAPMPEALLSRWMEMYPKLSFYQAYGMTECAATVCALTPHDHRIGGEILKSVGRPCVGVEVEIRDPETASPLPTGEVGELWIRCDSTMTEYWKKPEATAHALVDGWYRSGDAGRINDDGYVFLADRVKDMIVSGGENVYSLEVENAISTHPAVTQVAVVGRPHEIWGEAVHAFVVCTPGSVTEAELDAHARKLIAGYKVPKSWTLQSEPLPLSAAAKVLKRELRQRLIDSGK
jgi:acyl-CoA synthetase (AMP-forming)/AMP-acid ligase II